MKSLATEKVQSEPEQHWISETGNDGSKLQEIIAASGISVLYGGSMPIFGSYVCSSQFFH